MRPSFHSRLVNGPFQDPGLLVSWVFRKRAVLFDLGDLGNLSPGDILKISHVFISHTHMDHFVGFDQLVRLMLGRAKKITIFGPKGFLDNVGGKLQGYTWNLVENYPESLVLDVIEVHPDQHLKITFDCRTGFQPGRKTVENIENTVLYQDPEVEVSAAILDHAIPCLAFALQEPFHINIIKTELEALGLSTGPWVSRFKQLLYGNADPHTRIKAPFADNANGHHTFELADLAAQIARTTVGQKIAYVADAVSSPSNQEKIVHLARDADHLFIEAAFLHTDKSVARAKHHLTARQAGRIARRAGAKKMTVFHFSPRYHDRGYLLEEEARQAFEDDE